MSFSAADTGALTSGVRERVTEELSIGDYVLSGAIAALVMIDAIARLVPGVVGDERSVAEFVQPGAARFPAMHDRRK